jgi:hypothetical protein
MSWASQCAGKSYTTCRPLCGDPVNDTLHACTLRLLFSREILRAVDSEYATIHVDIASVQGFNLLSTTE